MLLINVCFWTSLIILSLVYLNPFIFYGLGLLFKPLSHSVGDIEPSIEVLIVTRNAGKTIARKLENTLSLNYPTAKLKIIVFSDGSTDDTADQVRTYASDRIHLIESTEHVGKMRGLNVAAAAATAEIIVFTDTDATLPPGALRLLVRHFADPKIGGVSGKKAMRKTNSELGLPQHCYNAFSDTLKRMESRLGWVASNDGTLFAMRRNLFKDIPAAVTDDLYICLFVVLQGKRFLYEPEATASLTPPSETPEHELQRRRRIVSTSLRGIVKLSPVLNPFRFGAPALSLFANKVLRRCSPPFLVLLFLSSMALAGTSPLVAAFFNTQLLAVFLALLHLASNSCFVSIPVLGRLASFAFFFFLGNMGTMLGAIDFLRGKKIEKWTPKA